MKIQKDQAIYLLSSNASKEYMVDALESLLFPSGIVQHFRYQLKWVDKNLREKLPLKAESEKERNRLKNCKVVICYLYQEKKNNQWNWIHIYPFRTGILMDAYRTGKEDHDIAHFYFTVENYVHCEGENHFINKIKGSSSVWGKAYAFFEERLKENDIAFEAESYSSFVKICDFLKEEYFKSPDGSKEYYPIFCFIEGVKSQKEELSPKYDSLSHKSYYEISEGSKYCLEFRTYFPKNPPEFPIIIKTDEKLFSTPSKYKIDISSRYTEESCILISRFLERDVYTLLSFETELQNSSQKEPLNLHLHLPIKIKRKLSFRWTEILGDVGLAVGTVLIALSKVGWREWSWKYWLLIILSYLTWIVCKIVVKLCWRG